MTDTNPKPGGDSSDEIRRRGSLVIQTLPILMIPIGVTLLTFLFLRFFVIDLPPEAQRSAASPLVPVLVLVVFCSALILLVRLRRPTLSALVLLGAWTLVTTLATVQSGVSSNMVALLIIPICVAGLLIDAAASVSLAALATLLVITMAWLEQADMLTVADRYPAFLIGLEPIIAASFWVSMFWTITALTSLLSGGLQRALRESSRRAAELRTLSEELEARVQAQAAELVAQAEGRAVLEERTRLAREIHDTIAQGLAGVAVQVGAARQGLALLDGEARIKAALAESLTLAERTTRETLAEARRSVWNLRAPILERGSLRDALEQVVAQARITAAFSCAGAPWPLKPTVESALLRVVQEALANAARHGGAQKVQVELRYGGDALTLQIRDDGAGYPAEVLAGASAPGPWGGFGLLGMRERIAGLDGSLELRNDGGAQVLVSVPRPAAELG